jgi:hypothetical protein
MPFEGGKMNQIAIQSEGWHSILDGFLCVGCRFSDRQPDFFQYLLNILWEARDIFINGLGGGLIRFHGFPYRPNAYFG